MNTTVAVSIIVVVLLAGGAYYAIQSDSDTESRSEAEQTNDAESFTGTIEGLLALGRDVTCTFTEMTESGEIEGTVYVSGERMRGDFIMRSADEGNSFDGSMIHQNGTMYMWGSTPQGEFATQMDVSAEAAPNDSNAPAEFTNEEVAYDCSPWQVNESRFELPSDVTFTDMNMQMEAMQQSTGGMQCSTCDDIPDESARSQCRTALNCN